MAGFAGTTQTFIQQYGLLAVFVYMFLESALLLHFTPSEVVLPFAAALLVHGPVGFAVFVVVATGGGTAGGVFAYYVFGRGGEYVLTRYGSYPHLSADDLERGQRVFRRWGESTVFFCRLLPVLRAVISIPAGVSEMAFRRFLLYTASGTAVFVTALTYLAYSGTRAGTPAHHVLTALVRILTLDVQYVKTHVSVVLSLVVLLVAAFVVVWTHREWIRSNPAAAKAVVLRVVGVVGTALGLLFITSAMSVPVAAYSLVTWVWNDPRFLVVSLGLSPRMALVVTGLSVLAATFIVYEGGKHVPVSAVFRFDSRD
jgi:membrane protein DedA with SNARE-associated domain